MKIVYRIISFIIAILLVSQIAFTNTYAFAAAPLLGASAVSELFAELLTTFGFASSSDVDKMSFDDMQFTLDSSIESVDADTGRYILDFLFRERDSSSFDHNAQFQANLEAVTNKAFANYSSSTLVNNSDEYIVDTSTTDTKGYGAKAVVYSQYNTHYYYISYIKVVPKSDGSFEYVLYTGGNPKYEDVINSNGNHSYGYPQHTTTSNHVVTIPNDGYKIEVFGDVRYKDGTPAPTDDETAKVIGTTSFGDVITADMVNPVDGSVTTKDGTKVLPKDFLDLSKFTDKAILQLLKALIDAINNATVSDNTLPDEIVTDVAVELDIAELNNLKLPTGIASVFPFCLPFDFVRGLQLLAVAPVAPKFVIPFEIPKFGLFGGFKQDIVLDFAEYSKYFEVGRWVQTVIFVISLCFISYKVVQGVH